jgi:hypothetical protein
MKKKKETMISTKGYFCPTCELRFSINSVKNGLLPCGCNTKAEDAPYIEIHRRQNIRDLIKLSYKSFKVESDKRRYSTFFNYVRKKSMEIVQQDLLLKAVINARFENTVYKNHWKERCSKCACWLKDSTKCSKVDLCLMTCNVFKLDPDYALKPVWGRPMQ